MDPGPRFRMLFGTVMIAVGAHLALGSLQLGTAAVPSAPASVRLGGPV